MSEAQPVMMSATDAAAWMAGAHLVGPDAAIRRVTTDSRTVQPGDLFVALIGERFDAHDFLPDVVARGAAAVLVSRPLAGTLDLSGVAVLTVADTRIALGQLAAGWRRQFPIPVVAVTGSNGKTTVKEMISAVFARAVGEEARLATAGNLNNDIGLPLTLFRLHAQHRLAVLELGMNHPGETEVLATIAQPTVALINNAQREHQEFMVSVEAVATEHAAVLAALPADGVAVFPRDAANGGEYAPLWRAAAGTRRVLDFGIEGGAVSATVTDTADGQHIDVHAPDLRFSFTLPLLGVHNARNALAATACSLAAGIAPEVIAQALSAFAPVKGACSASRAFTAGWWSTTPTTRTRIPCALPSMRWRRCRHRAGWCWAIWARWARRDRRSIRRSARMPASAASTRFWPPVSWRAIWWIPSAAAHGISRRPRR
ncbi:UDP-N-acetylmuramoyl-tripeptide--D-alanyl-D-alanine ligase [Ralstonia syzygii]